MKAIIIGATSGIGRELAKQMSAAGYIVGITGRRTQLLDSLAAELTTDCYKANMDLTNVSESVKALEDLFSQMGDVDIIVINAGTGSVNPQFPLVEELETIAVNVTGFTAMANAAYHYFTNKNGGHIVGISSISALRGGPVATYNASKAYVSNYLEGLSCRASAQNADISVTDIRPGFVDTKMTNRLDLPSKLTAKPDDVAVAIIKATKKRRDIIYIKSIWRQIMFVIKCIPEKIFKTLNL